MFPRDGLRGKAAYLAAQPSLHAARSLKRHQARLRQQNTIEQLQMEVQTLKKVWWDDDFCWIPVRKVLEQRLRDMATSLEVHRERCYEKGRHFHYARQASVGEGAAEQMLHQRTNESKHGVFFQEHEKSIQEHREFEPFSFLAGMAAEVGIVNAGAIIAVSPVLRQEDEWGDGDSLLNGMLAKRKEIHTCVADVISSCSDSSWQLVNSDIVYIGNEQFPSRVYRQGYDHYECEVRVARLDEDHTVWTNGRWVSTDRCFKLEVGDKLRATCDIEDATDNQRRIPRDAIIRYRGLDKDGDVLVTICGTPVKTVVFYEDLVHFSLE